MVYAAATWLRRRPSSMVTILHLFVFLALPLSAAMGAEAPPDSMQSVLSDSLLVSSALSDTASADAGEYGSHSRGPVRVELAPWGRKSEKWRGAEAQDLSDLLRRYPEIQLREMGDPGSRAFLSIYPQGGAAPEFYVDGVPSRSPGDVEPSIYDRSLTPLRSLRVSDVALDAGGAPALHAELEPPVDGSSRLTSHFTRTSGDTFFRGLSFRTPRAVRTLQFDFEEWKTEEGYASFSDPNFVRPSDFGRAKMRRFEVGGQSVSDAGLVSVRFGRGRRFHDGHILGTQPLPGPLERWSGIVSVGLDRGDSSSHTRARIYHLDWQDRDAGHANQMRDAARLGFLSSRSPVHDGFGWLMQAERWSAMYIDAVGATVRPKRVYSGRLGTSHRSGSSLRRVFSFEIVATESAPEPIDFGGGAQIGLALGSGEIALSAQRQLRMVTLAESGGQWQTDFADGVERTLLGAGELPMERHDRVAIKWTTRLWNNSIELRGEQWWLSRGVGWKIVDNATARYHGGVEVDHRQLSATVRRGFGTRRLGARLRLSGFHALDELSSASGRGTGWPTWWAITQFSLWTRFFHDNNTLRFDYSANYLGTRLDDLLTPLAGATTLPREIHHDLRLALRIRDAELYFAWDNILDETITEIVGGRDRGRQRRLGLYWRFYN